MGEYLVAKRFWVVQGTEYAVSDGGFLSDPDQEYGSSRNPGLITLESIRTERCAVLLGASGMGKSTALNMAYGTEARSLSGNVTTRRIDLGLFDTGQSLRDVLARDDAMGSPHTGDDVLELVFDSCDECRVNNVVAVIASELADSKAILNRLRLRIACRSSYWPSEADKTLTKLFGSETPVYELCPLRRVDVEQIAEAQLTDSQTFVRDLYRHDLVPLAARPVTLKFLLQEYQENPATFSAMSQVELYDRGMERLAIEENSRRNEGPLATPVGVDVRRGVAERLGMLSTLTGKRRLRLQPRQSLSQADEGVLSYEDAVASLKNGVDLCGFQPDVALRATFDYTAFFAASSPGCVTWAHASYADFLAANYVVGHRVKGTKIAELLLVANTNGKIIGQLRPLAGWLTAMSVELRGILSRENPALVFEKDSAVPLSEADKRDLVDALLQQHCKPDVLYVDPALTDKLGGLGHAGVVEQLRKYLTDSRLALPARELAVLCVREMQLRDLSDDCLRIALDVSQPSPLRESAVEATAAAATRETRQKLRSLVVTSEGRSHEPHDVYATAAKVLWKDGVTTQELFDSLPLPRESTLGQYEYFLEFTLGPSLAEADLPYALDWVSHLDGAWLESYGAHSLVDTIIRKSWQLASSAPGQFPAAQFAAAYWNLTNQRDSAFLENHGNTERELLISGPAETRRQIAQLVLSCSNYADKAPFVVAWSSTPLLNDTDFEWTLQAVKASESHEEREALAKLASYLFRHESLPHVVLLLDHQDTTEIHDRFKELTDPVLLDSDKADKMKAHYKSAREFELRQAEEENQRRQREAELPTSATIAHIAASVLSDTERSTFQRWYSFYVAVSIASEKQSPHIRYLDVAQLSAWNSLDANAKDAASQCALNYLREVDPSVEEGVAGDKWSYGAIYGLPCLVLAVRQYGLDGLPDELVDRWLPALLAYPADWAQTERERVTAICVSLAMRRPHTVVQAARFILEKYALSQNPFTNVLQRLELVWSDGICQITVDTLNNPSTGLGLMSWCIEVLCTKGVQQAREIGLAVVRSGAVEGGTPETTERAIVAAQSLAQACPDWWNLLWESLSQKVSLAKGFVQRIAGGYYGQTPRAIENLTEDQIATLYTWIVDNIPEISEPIQVGASRMTPTDQIRDLANALLNGLQKRTTFASVEALRRLRDRYTDRPWLRRAVAECEDEYYAATWSPPSVDDLTALIDQPATRYVSDEHDLLTVLEEQLDVLQQRLRGETPACWELWNEWKQSRVTLWRPREETLVSDWVKDRLDLILSGSHVVINREVEIRRGVGPAAPGQNPDVHVVATRDTAPNVEVIIEVKGCWNADLLTGMRRQLAHRYLADNACHTGIYLVAWSNWSKWDKGDTRRGRAFRHNRSQLEALLSHQAAELGVEGYTVVARLLDLTPPNARSEGD